MQFKEVVGQKVYKERLLNAMKSGRVGHAQMILGPEGSGAFELCLAYAAYLLCEHKEEMDSCGKCVPCRQMKNFSHPDVHFSYPFYKKGETTIADDFSVSWLKLMARGGYFTLSDWKELLDVENKSVQYLVTEAASINRKMSLKSFSGSVKIVIMWLPELMNADTANKLLKLIEEPPENSLLLFPSENSSAILPTIMSRLQLTKISKIQDEDIRLALAEKTSWSGDQLESAVNFVDGNFAKALKLIKDSDLENPHLDIFMEWARAVYKPNVKYIVSWSDKMQTAGREECRQFLDFALHMFRQCLLANYAGDALTRMSSKEQDFAVKFSPFIHHGNIMSIVEEINTAFRDINRNAYIKVVLTDLSLTMHKLLRINPEMP